MTKVLSYGIVSLLAVALLAGTGYILLNPVEAQAGQGSLGGQGQGQGHGGDWQGDEGMENDAFAYGRGRGRGNDSGGVETPAQTTYGRNEATQGRGASGGAGASDEHGRNSAGQGRDKTGRTIEWETLAGEVIIVDGEVTIQTAGGEVLVGLGQAAYRADFVLEIGDDVSVTGFYENGEFKAGTVENLTTGETIVLRDEAGRPMWSGQGRLKNRE
jgi:hypothetical protein